MSTLLLRLVGPMQAWDVQSNFSYRLTGLEPSKSGVIGLLCAALGKPRDELPNDQRFPTLAELATLKMGVRVDREGQVRRDFQTAGKDGYLKADGDVTNKNVVVSPRWYLADAAFLVGVEGDVILLQKLHSALQDPYWALFLGRKAFVPSEPIYLPNNLQEMDLLTALDEYKRLRPKRHKDDPDWMRGLVEDNEEGEIVRQDHHISFARGIRKFALRRMRAVRFEDRPLLEELKHVSLSPNS